ncbi:uncharacterized protein MELLADRAFT_84827 [Melampsora larici-populina 98AG31]|uniref:Uncharacterized protein n=1 Tax=Melampsora larici-populina (strain 98AG31 / pathotype 3-4-7) TaxID=747676 RepID=F4SCL6_MELLP|nr:uncharacterized protein MELLADRAFT_84827 [Melampsora larici-populina 98AG31]EGF97615.1 hypothetical protein MELLADRAFT_84827 [Melampsora larici-populina 98AG31]
MNPSPKIHSFPPNLNSIQVVPNLTPQPSPSISRFRLEQQCSIASASFQTTLPAMTSTTTRPFIIINDLPALIEPISGIHRTTHPSFRSDHCHIVSFQPTLDPFRFVYSRLIMQNLSQAQINMDDTSIGVRPYPSTRSGRHSALAAPAESPVPETEATGSVGVRSPLLPLANDVFGPPEPRDPSPAESSDIEIISSTFPRVPLSDKKPVLIGIGAQVPSTQQLSVAYSLCLLKGTDISKGPAKKNAKPVYSTIPIPATKKPFDVRETSLARLKARLFDLASEIDNDPTKGNTAILQTADAMKQVKILAFITAHDTWAKNQDRHIEYDVDVTSFFQSVVGAPGKNAGFVIMMENPARSAQEANDELTKNQARLRAQNTLNNVGTTASDLAHATPKGLDLEDGINLPPFDPVGSRIGTKDVTIDDPPTELEEFFWIDVKPVKRPSLTATPSVAKRLKVEEDCRPSEFEFGSYVEMQSSTVRVDFKTLRHIEVHSMLQQYLTWCKINYLKIGDYVQIFFKHSITSFHCFLFPSVLSAQTIASWGIPYGVVMELMTRPREYYSYQVNKLEELMNRRAARDASAEAHGDHAEM